MAAELRCHGDREIPGQPGQGAVVAVYGSGWPGLTDCELEGLPPVAAAGQPMVAPAGEGIAPGHQLEQTDPVCCRCSSKLPPRWVLLEDGRGCCAGCAKRGEGALQEPT